MICNCHQDTYENDCRKKDKEKDTAFYYCVRKYLGNFGKISKDEQATLF